MPALFLYFRKCAGILYCLYNLAPNQSKRLNLFLVYLIELTIDIVRYHDIPDHIGQND